MILKKNPRKEDWQPTATQMFLNDYDSNGQKVTEIKFFKKDGELMIALFTDPPGFWCSEYWLKNVRAKDYGITELPSSFQLEKKYNSSTINLSNLRVNNDSYQMQKAVDSIATVAIKSIFGLFF